MMLVAKLRSLLILVVITVVIIGERCGPAHAKVRRN